MTFLEWMRAVDREVIRRSGVSVYDLGDYPFMDTFQSEASPEVVAEMILAEEGFPSDEDGDGYEGDIE